MPKRTPWWIDQRKKLLKIATQQKSAYVYDRKQLRENAALAHHIKGISSVFYAIKANNNAAVLQEFYEAGLGFECVSIEEVRYILRLFPNIAKDRILFTPNFAPKHEYKEAFERGLRVTIDNIYPLKNWRDIFRDNKLLLRIDTGNGLGHHDHVKTGGNHSKFGIPAGKIDEVKEIVNDLNATVIGLHAHSGSGIINADLWARTAEYLHNIAPSFKDVQFLNVGGGFGIYEDRAQAMPKFGTVNQSLASFTQSHSNYKLWIEPGRLLTATAGVLLGQITQLKQKGDTQYIGLNTGMNSLIRPPLYGSNHLIINLSKWNEPRVNRVNIVGPICESGDKLGADVPFPASQEGDVVLIANAGAYGRVMSSSYNMRPPADEVII